MGLELLAALQALLGLNLIVELVIVGSGILEKPVCPGGLEIECPGGDVRVIFVRIVSGLRASPISLRVSLGAILSFRVVRFNLDSTI